MPTPERQCATTGLGDPSTVTPPTSSPPTWPERQGKPSGLGRRQTGSAPAHICRIPDGVDALLGASWCANMCGLRTAVRSRLRC